MGVVWALPFHHIVYLAQVRCGHFYSLAWSGKIGVVENAATDISGWSTAIFKPITVLQPLINMVKMKLYINQTKKGEFSLQVETSGTAARYLRNWK